MHSERDIDGVTVLTMGEPSQRHQREKANQAALDMVNTVCGIADTAGGFTMSSVMLQFASRFYEEIDGLRLRLGSRSLTARDFFNRPTNVLTVWIHLTDFLTQLLRLAQERQTANAQGTTDHVCGGHRASLFESFSLSLIGCRPNPTHPGLDWTEMESPSFRGRDPTLFLPLPLNSLSLSLSLSLSFPIPLSLPLLPFPPQVAYGVLTTVLISALREAQRFRPSLELMIKTASGRGRSGRDCVRHGTASGEGSGWNFILKVKGMESVYIMRRE